MGPGQMLEEQRMSGEQDRHGLNARGTVKGAGTVTIA